MTKRISDLPPKLVGEKILSKVPITSLREVRSTCKSWEALSKDWIVGKEAAARQQYLGFMTMDSEVCSVRFHLRRKEEEEEDLVDLSIKQVALLDQVEISKAEPFFHCDGLLLCVAKDNSRLVVWNPSLGQTRWIRPRTSFHRLDRYALGYDMHNRNHKVLRFLDYYHYKERKHLFGFEIYDLGSNSWRVIDVRPDWEVDSHQRGVSLKGNIYFFAHEKIGVDFFAPLPQGTLVQDTEHFQDITEDFQDFLLCFDFTTERFGQRLPLPFHSYNEETVTLSCVRDEQLAVLNQKDEDRFDILEIWVTTRIEPNAVSWSKFLSVDMRQLPGVVGTLMFYCENGSFFIDEQEKVAVVFDVDENEPTTETARYHTAFIFGDKGYFKSVRLGEALNVGCYPDRLGYIPPVYQPALVCPSSYLPSLVQLNHTPKRKERDDFINHYDFHL
ncbi:hypothetical protein EUTSA_v10009753mg [Eutrema salsugineum]|uniref:F-box domain-containing protein n=1 Tax=Eutrema salsugineum TaxID=72664 RepID=V4L284_EUTSA|nr:hypothetical protein EUTSA_v10009753mg [Eutrema salsugineum]